ncbi:hypothetical protein Asi03nite_26620 [Actinoplanes siamensis]|uniref:Secreted protein n=1 Tax=Actinoplanes siamensis TaxID=1223317 RepID=A0A919TKC1_9ACTN|nr:hypothetical protein Asi03nite_26620 [Actinoplanes siamensis]
MIFLDVDGTLIPLRARTIPATPTPPTHANPLLARIDPADGPRLRSLDGELTWASTWMEEANAIISPRLGLPHLPVVDWPDEDPVPGLHWKTAFLTEYAQGRPFVWLDDEVTDTDQRWVAAHHSGRALLRRVYPFTGLTDADFAAVRAWLVVNT